MDDLTQYTNRPLAFFARYIRTRRVSHAAILVTVIAAVGFSVSTQYGIKFLVDTLSGTSEQQPLGGLLHADVFHRSRQPALACGELDC